VSTRAPFNPIQTLAAFFQSNTFGEIEQCAEITWTTSTQSLIRTVDSVLFLRQGLPQKWLLPLLRPGPGHTTAAQVDLSHGRGVCDVRVIQGISKSFELLMSTLFSKLTHEICEHMRPDSGRTPWLQVDSAIVIVNAIRSTRTPFMLLSERTAPVTESFVVIVSFRAGTFVALWDERAPDHRLESVACVFPLLSESTGLCFLNSPLCFVAPRPTHSTDLGANCLVLFVSVLKPAEEGAIPPTIEFSFKPEFFLVKTAHVPPLVRCAVCLGAIRDRKFDFEGSSKHNNDTIKGGGQHCLLCSSRTVQGEQFPRFLLCEFCSKSDIPNVPLTPCDEEVATAFAALMPSTSSSLKSPAFRCFHSITKVDNRVQDVVWTILHPQEFIAGAKFFLDFTLSATWLEDLAPTLIVEMQQRCPVMVWDAFFRVHVNNSHCNRAKLSLFAVQFALNLTGMFKPRGKDHKRELFFVSRLPFARRHDDMMTERVKLLTEMANGLIRSDVLCLMARRLIKYLNSDTWGQVLYCSCSESGGVPSDDYQVGSKRTRCDGPSLHLGLDGGIAERLSWGAFDAATSEQVRRLRVYQRELTVVSNNTSTAFKAGQHVHLPRSKS